MKARDEHARNILPALYQLLPWVAPDLLHVDKVRYLIDIGMQLAPWGTVEITSKKIRW